MGRGPQETLRIRTRKHLGPRLGIRVEELLNVVAAHSHLYRTFHKKCSSGKVRKLFAPEPRLRIVLVSIKNLLREVAVPPEIIGGRPGGALTAFARPHIGKPFLIEMDIKGFYPNTTSAQVRSLFADDLRCGDDVADMLTRLTTAENQLPQGFNTSSDIGNLLLRPCVRRLAGLCQKHGLALTVWVDNIVLSGDERLAGLRGHVRQIVEECGFELSRCVPLPHQRAQTICGITVNDRLSVRRSRREEIEATIGAVGDGNMCAVCARNARKLQRQIRGKIQSVRNVNAGQGRRLYHVFHELRDADWDCVCE